MNIKKLIIYILIPVGLSFLVSILTNPSFSGMIKPSFAPPKILFPIVWTILYILMGVSSYFISESNDERKDKALIIYFIQLFINLLWSFFFFTYRLYLFAFIWIVLLITMVIIMIIYFSKINKLSAYLQVPYLIWIVFASILNYSIYLLN